MAVCALAAACIAVFASDDVIRFGHRRVGRAATVDIYPTADRVPENLLRVYLVFDRPMSAGESRAHLHLLDEHGHLVDRAFLQLDEELWDPTGRRLTVLFDPGRIKRGLRANIEDGPPLREGGRYRLVVDAGWRDADGRPLGRGTSRTFLVTAPDRRRPSVDEWTMEPPGSGTRAPLVVRFPEPLDRALLSSAVSVIDAAGGPVHGAIEVGEGEDAWTFTPDLPWHDWRYALAVSALLEDVAGNSLERVFDADLLRPPTDRQEVPRVVLRPFRATPET